MTLYKREKYLSKIRPFFHDEGMVKVLTGVRRCGKSCIMQTIAVELKDAGVPASNIIYLDLDERKNRKIKTADQLEGLIDAAAEVSDASCIRYLFIDEVQNVEDSESLVNGYRTDDGWSIFLTGSNAYLLSGELATKLTGRHLEFEAFTLDFDEYLGMKRMLGHPVNANLDIESSDYLRVGGFPGSLNYEADDQKRFYVEGIIEEIFEKDIKRRVKVRHVSVFNAVRDYLINNYGATTSITNLLSYFNNVEHIAIKRETLNRYIQILVDAKFFTAVSALT